MDALEIRSFRNEDNSVSMVIVVPARRNGEPNFGAIARVNRELLWIDPAAFDPSGEQSATSNAPYEEQAVAHHAVEAPMPPLVELHEGDDCPEESLKGGEAYREHGA